MYLETIKKTLFKMFFFCTRILKALKENERDEELIMKDVKDWNVGESVYNTTKWITPMPDQILKL